MDDKSPIYNSRIVKIYVEYLKKHYPDIDIGSILDRAEMTRYEVEDSAHWFSQEQVDRLHDILVKETGDTNIARESGRYAVSADVMGTVRHYVLGLADLTTIYMLIGKIYPLFSLGASVKAKKIAPRHVEIVSTPNEGVNEKPYQCGNRLGHFEGIAKLFTKGLAKIEHPTCFHEGGDACLYVIKWQMTPSLLWKRLRDYSFWLSVVICTVLFFILPDKIWFGLVFFCGLLTLSFFCYYSHLEKRELIKTIERQGDTAKGHLDEINKRYNDALLVQEIGKAATTNLDVKELIHAVVGLMERRLEYDCGMIMLVNEEKSRLQYIAGYGYSREEEERLRQSELLFDAAKSGEALMGIFKKQEYSPTNNVSEKAKGFSKDMETFAEENDAGSLIWFPIVYEKEALGILAVDSRAVKRSLAQSDMNLLMGLASQIATGIVNAMSFNKLREGEERYRTILESIEEGYFEVDLTGSLTFFNDALYKILGYPRLELLGLNHRDYTTPEAAKKMYKVFNQVYKSGNPARVTDYEIITKDGDRRMLELSTSLVRNQAGERTGFRGVVRDVTDRLSAEREKKKLEAQLHQAQKMESIGIIASGVAHNFRNVLAGISANSQLLELMYRDDEQLCKIAKGIGESIKTGAQLIDGLMKFSRKEGREKFEILNMAEVIRETSDLATAAFDKSIQIRVDVPEVIPVMGDHAGLKQIMMNLFTNARDAMPDGGELHIKARQKAERVEVIISDTGHGMNKETLEKCFDPFFTTKSVDKGTGLGLSTAYGIAKEHGGDMHAYSELGKGTIFKIYFPNADAPGKDNKEQRQAIETGKGQKVLIADDEASLLMPMEQMLESLGYRVSSAGNGVEALAKYISWRPDAVLLDRNMPKMDGITCAKKIIKADPQAIIVLISGYDERGPTGIDAGSKGFIKGYLTKPLDITQLSRILIRLFNSD